jgi:hypothetical protein
MKCLRLTLGLLFAVPALLSAQVMVEVKLEQAQFLAGEPLVAAVDIKNRSGQTLRLGTDADWLTFSLESRDGFIVVKNDDVPVPGAFDLESSQVATRRVDLAPYFTLPKQGRYSVTATVHLKEWNAQLTSSPKSFDIIEGAKLWSQEFGVPLPPGVTNQPPEVRKFTLEQANYLRNELRLYMRLTDEAGTRTFKVATLGSMVSVGQPEAQLDKLSQLHVLYRNGPRAFSYSVFSADGELLVRQSYDYAGSRPRLAAGESGAVVVSGGARRPTSSDVPPPKPAAMVPPATQP